MSIPYLEATWTPTSLAANFDHYELERSQDGGVEYEPVAFITIEAANVFRDYEAIREVPAHYRLRVQRIDGALSDWTPVEINETPAGLWALVSNEAPDLNQEVDVWRDDEEQMTWEFGTNEAIYEIAGRDGAVAQKGLEKPYDRFTLNVVITDPTHPERRVFDDLLELVSEALAYVAVHSPASRRWLANLTLPEGGQRDLRQTYTAPIRVRELTRVSSIIDLAEA